MKLLTFKFLLIFSYLLSSSSSYSIEEPKIKNFIVHKEPQILKNITFKNSDNETIDLVNFKKSLIILNFWATWCMPCREELPSLNLLKNNNNFNNLEVFPINVASEDLPRINTFWSVLNIDNLKIYLDPDLRLPSQFNLRGIPTTIFINKKGKEFARVVGYIDFNDKDFVKWLKNFD
tara:strand:- start:2919 stop:3449 length:531 start_codon:yes stop_codon:yes gene_type:complete